MRVSSPQLSQPLTVVFLTALLVFSTVKINSAQPPGSGNSSHVSTSNITFDRANKKSILGDVTLGHATGTQMKSPQDIDRTMIRLREALLKYTRIDAKVDRQIRLSSREIMKLPFVYIAFEGGFDLTKAESDNLNAYLKSGGFIMIDKFDISREDNPAESAFGPMINKALGSRVRVHRLQNSHQIFSSYFDFPEGPPLNVNTGSRVMDSTSEVNYLEGITMNGRLVGICSSKYSWGEMQLQFGINAIVFALTQKGGIAQK